VAGHLHPCARVRGGGKSVRRRCFAGDGERLVLPAFGAYAGGLDVLDPALIDLFSPETFRAFVLGDDRVYPVGMRALTG
jgi:metallophosphoesterase superfamily enzyme